MGALGSAIGGLAKGILGGIGAGKQASKVQHDYEVQRNMAQDLANQSGQDYYNLFSPTQYGYNQMAFNGGYTPGEQAQLYLTPQEQASQYYSPQEQQQMLIGQPEAAALRSQALDPISGAATRAQQQLGMSAAARGGYAPGVNAAVEQVQRVQGQQGANAAQQVGLGISAANRAAYENIANQRAQTARNLALYRSGISGQIGQARMQQQQAGLGGLGGLQQLASQRQFSGLGLRGQAVAGEAGSPGGLQAGVQGFQQGLLGASQVYKNYN